MKRVIDLSHAITHQMSVFPDDPAVGILNHHNYKNGYFVNQIIMGTHTGTHIDVPIHKIPGAKSLDDMPVERFFGRALVMDMTFLQPGEEIQPEQLKPFTAKLDGCHAVIIKTNWSDHFGKTDFFSDFPGISEAATDWFLKNEITLIGLESPSVHAQEHIQIHTLLLQNEIVIVESLNNVRDIQGEYVDFFAVPLKLKGLDGSPVRAYAIENI